MITVDSWDDLLKLGTDLISEKIDPNNFEIKKDLTVEIQIRGQSWDGSIDYRGAGYILELQKAVNRIYTEVHGDTIPLRSLSKLVTVKVKVVQGSIKFNINLGQALSKMVGQMTGGQLLVFAGLTMATAVGLYTAKTVAEYKKDVAIHARQMEKDEALDKNEKELLSKTVNELTTTINRALDVIEERDLQAPTRKLVNKLESGDMILMPDAVELTAEEAKKRYPRKPPVKAKSGIFDGTYTIRSMFLDKSPVEFSIDKDDHCFNAAAELHSSDIERLAQDFEKALKSGANLEVPLQVFVMYGKNKIISASITGVGDPRERAENIAELFQSK